VARENCRADGLFPGASPLDYCVTHVQNFWIPELMERKEFREHRISKPLPLRYGHSVARRDFFNAVGPFNLAINHADDTEWFLRATERGSCDGVIVRCAVVSASALHQSQPVNASNSRDQYLRVLKTALDRRRRLNNT